MIKTRHVILIFTPALLFAAVAFFLRLAQYKPLYPREANPNQAASTPAETLFIPIFPDDPIMGDKKAGKTLIAFEDIACPRCHEQMEIFRQLLNEYPGKLKIIWKGLPVTRFPYPSAEAHRYGYCANQQGKFSAVEQALAKQTEALRPDVLQTLAEEANLDQSALTSCLNSGAPEQYQKKTEELARVLGITAVPAVFLDNRRIAEPETAAGWKNLLQL